MGKTKFEITKPMHMRAAGRFFAECMWGPYQDCYMVDPVTICRGALNYPKAIEQSKFQLQLQYLLTEIQPELARLDNLMSQYTRTEWEASNDLLAAKTPPQLALDGIKRRLKAAWKDRPK